MSRDDRDEHEHTKAQRKWLENHFDLGGFKDPSKKRRTVVESKADRDRATAAGGVHPITGRWRAPWLAWPGRGWDWCKLTWFTAGPNGTGARAGRRTSEAKRESSRRNGRLGAAYGILGGRPRRQADA